MTFLWNICILLRRCIDLSSRRVPHRSSQMSYYRVSQMSNYRRRPPPPWISMYFLPFPLISGAPAPGYTGRRPIGFLGISFHSFDFWCPCPWLRRPPPPWISKSKPLSKYARALGKTAMPWQLFPARARTFQTCKKQYLATCTFNTLS